MAYPPPGGYGYPPGGGAYPPTDPVSFLNFQNISYSSKSLDSSAQEEVSHLSKY